MCSHGTLDVAFSASERRMYVHIRISIGRMARPRDTVLLFIFLRVICTLRCDLSRRVKRTLNRSTLVQFVALYAKDNSMLIRLNAP